MRVYNGTYFEHVVINKSLNLQGIDYPIIDAQQQGSPILINASNCLVEGFKVTNSVASASEGGIKIQYYSGGNNVIRNNIAYGNRQSGIYAVHTSGNLIANNTLYYNTRGIDCDVETDDLILNNTIYLNSDYGIVLGACTGMVIEKNYLYSHSNEVAIILDGCQDSNFTSNRVAFNNFGIYLTYSGSGNRFAENDITNNNWGIGWYSAIGGNYFYHNNITYNGVQARIIDPQNMGALNIWDNGFLSGGNYWSDYNGSDATGDGFGDTPYIIDANNQDHYPLMTANYVMPNMLQTTAAVNAQPNPVGIGQTVTILMSISPSPPTASDKFGGITLRIVHPDGKSETKGPFLSNATGSTYVLYTPTSVGNYTLQMTYPGETFSNTNTTYQASSSPVVSLKVQQEPVTSGSPPPTPSPNPTPTSYQPTPTPTWNPTPTPTTTIRPTAAPTLSPTPSPKYVPQPENVQPDQKSELPILAIAAVVAAVAVVVGAAVMLLKLRRPKK